MSREHNAGEWSPGYLGRDPVISRPHRDLLFDHFPELHHAPYARFFSYMAITGRWRDGALPIPATLLAAIERKQKAHRYKKYRAKAFIRAFMTAVPVQIEINEYRYLEGRAREITRVCLPDEIDSLLTEMAETPMRKTEDPVYLVSGRPYNRENADRIENDLSNDILRSAETPMCEEQSVLLGYMNTLPSNGFSSLRHNLEMAWEYAALELDANKRRRALQSLRQFEQQSHPLYRPSYERKTVRLVSDRSPLLYMKRGVREILTQAWAWVDLKSAQLAVAARDWNVKPVLDALESGSDIWAELIATLCGPDRSRIEHLNDSEAYAELKDIVKRFLYAAIFGMSIKRLGQFGGDSKQGHETRLYLWCRGIDPEEAGRRLLKHTLIRSLLDSRNLMFQKIIRAGGGIDGFGNRYRCITRDQAGSVLASLAQARELELMLPVIEYARECEAPTQKPSMRLMTWVHDGAHIAVRDRSRERRTLERIKDRVDREAHRRGYPTFLEIETSAERKAKARTAAKKLSMHRSAAGREDRT